MQARLERDRPLLGYIAEEGEAHEDCLHVDGVGEEPTEPDRFAAVGVVAEGGWEDGILALPTSESVDIHHLSGACPVSEENDLPHRRQEQFRGIAVTSHVLLTRDCETYAVCSRLVILDSESELGVGKLN